MLVYLYMPIMLSELISTMTGIIFLIFYLLNVPTGSGDTNNETPDEDSTSSTVPSWILSTPSVLDPTIFFNYLKEDKAKDLYAELLAGLNDTVLLFEHNHGKEVKRRKFLEKEMLPFRLCCEPQYLRYNIDHAKEMCGVSRANVLFFEEKHRKEWIELIIEHKDEDNFAGRLYRTLAEKGMDVEDFVNQTQIVDMRASVAIHSYLSRSVKPPTAMTMREKLRENRFTLSVTHVEMFNMLADVMNISRISHGDWGIVKVDLCDKIIDLENKAV